MLGDTPNTGTSLTEKIIPRLRTARLHIVIRGAVQGVGFRPFIFRLATEMGLTGWVRNNTEGVFLEVEGRKDVLDTFLLRIQPEHPSLAFIQSLEPTFLDPAGYKHFEIRASTGGTKTAFILPDIATCPECLREIFDTNNRRYLYPFTNCTHCGPRFSIIESLPYDRPNTSMRFFPMCAACRAEYENPADRRFHAQPNACPDCGPHLSLLNARGDVLQTHHKALLAVSEALRSGRIVAVKGLGGFHLMVDARSEGAVDRLRRRKQREEKPFALMFPTLGAVKVVCRVSDLEERLLRSPEAPIVLLHKKPPDHSQDKILNNPVLAPGNPYLGVMLPYTPLHHILLEALDFPVVATSGNLTDEPICFDEREAVVRLNGIADLFLVHNRPIVRHVDDSIARIMMGRELVLRRARGYAPLPILFHSSSHSDKHTRAILAVGAHLKNTAALSVGNTAYVSQHVGDLETVAAYETFQQVIKSFAYLYDQTPGIVACDMHPDYLSTLYASETGLPIQQVQHHVAHVLACMTENQLSGNALGVSWDGTGYGTDGTIWGGEFFLISGNQCRRVAHFLPFPLPGSDRAVREPRRSALGMLYGIWGDALFERSDVTLKNAFNENEWTLLRQMLSRNVRTPLTSSAGRIFDGIASLCGLRHISYYEGQAAMELEFAAGSDDPAQPYSYQLKDTASSGGTSIIIDWRPVVLEILADKENEKTVANISARFHQTLADIIGAVANQYGERRIVLSGGCFQNKMLTEQTIKHVQKMGFNPYWHQRIPPNDGGVSLGQLAAVFLDFPTNPE